MSAVSYFEEVTGFKFWDASSWSLAQAVVFVTGVACAFEFLGRIVPLIFETRRKIEMRGKHHDALDVKDLSFITFNRVMSIPFTYHFLKMAWLSPAVKWRASELTFFNTVVALPALFVVYDFFYTLFHRFLHHQSVYKYIHKHHHRQHAPSRGNLDAVNVHPFEFVVGEYDHLLALFLVTRLQEVHVATVLTFIVAGGILASLNHTRFDLRVPPGVYSVRVHDVHHRIPKANFGQYIMLWDRVFGSFQEYDETAGGRATKSRAD